MARVLPVKNQGDTAWVMKLFLKVNLSTFCGQKKKCLIKRIGIASGAALNFVARVANKEISNSNETAEMLFQLLLNLINAHQKTAVPDIQLEQ